MGMFKDSELRVNGMQYYISLQGENCIAGYRSDDGEITIVWELPIAYIFWGGRIPMPLSVPAENRERLLWIHEMTDEEFRKTGEYQAKGDSTGVLCAYTNADEYEAYLLLFTNMEQVYRRFAHFESRDARVTLKGRLLKVDFEGCIYTAKRPDIRLERAELVVDDNHSIPIPLTLSGMEKRYSKINVTVPIEDIVSQETAINNAIHIDVWVNGVKCSFNLGSKGRKKMPSRFYYVPTASKVYHDWVLFVRKNVNQNYSLVVRQREPVEYNWRFRVLESMPVSLLMYHLGKLYRRMNRRKINLFFEKDSMKAEEGTFEIFQKASESGNSGNYFILDPSSGEWDRLSAVPDVVAKYSLRYYWLLYSADCFIATETSSHLNVHRSRNKYVRRALLEKPLIFLQHGVTYLKCQGASSVFGRGKEGEPAYMIVGSEKERTVAARMLHIEEERCVITGLPVFSTISYEHIRDDSEDVVTVMLTWKLSEEHMLTHFEDSGYFQFVNKIYFILQELMPQKNIRIVPHPKVKDMLLRTRLCERVWQESVAEALRTTKLLITDYSSVCYNAFYQGAAVVFFQPDLAEYEKEVGRLIPTPEEYIGPRAFCVEELYQILETGLRDGRVNRAYLRDGEYVRRYREINQFHDGKNVERIVDWMKIQQII